MTPRHNESPTSTLRSGTYLRVRVAGVFHPQQPTSLNPAGRPLGNSELRTEAADLLQFAPKPLLVDETGRYYTLAPYATPAANTTSPSPIRYPKDLETPREPNTRTPENSHTPHFPFSADEQYFGTSVLANLASGASWNRAFANTFGASSLMQSGISHYLNAMTSSLFDDWTIDDDTPAEEVLAKQVSQQLIGQLQNTLTQGVTEAIATQSMAALTSDMGSIMDKMSRFFLGADSSAKLGAARDADPDTLVDIAKASAAPTVLVNGRPAIAALSSDVMVPSLKPILDGSTGVWLVEGGKLMARSAAKTAVPSAFGPCSPDVLVGGASPFPAAIAAAAKALAADKGLDSAQQAMMESNAAGLEALRGGASFDQANAVAETAANRPKADAFVTAHLANLGYRDGEEGLGTAADDPLKNGQRYTLDQKKTVTNPDGSSYQVDDWRLLQPGESAANTWTVEQVMEGSGYPSGYRAVLFAGPNGERVLVTNGTNLTSFSDWANNILQGFGFVPPQYKQALADAQRIQSDYPGLVLAGHSLGGGLATFAGSMTGLPVFAYNPAGLGSGSMILINKSGAPRWDGQTQVFDVDGEILTGSLLSEFLPNESGLIHHLPSNDSVGAVKNHQMTLAVIPGMTEPESGPPSLVPEQPGPVFIPRVR